MMSRNRSFGSARMNGFWVGVMALAIIGCAMAAPCEAAEPLKLYVSPNGNDLWSGINAMGGAPDGPLASLKGARDRVRRLKSKKGATDRGVRVIFADGVYELDKTVVFTGADSGSARGPITYEAAEGAKPVISGGRRITGFKLSSNGKVWETQIPAVAAGTWYFRQLFVNDKRYIRARDPNPEDYWYHIERQLAPMQGAVARFAEGDIKPFRPLDDAELVLLRIWNISRFYIESINMKERIITGHTEKPLGSMARWAFDKRYYLENAIEFLDSPGEWYLDRKTGKLYVMGYKGDNLAKADIVAPAVDRLLRFEGKPKPGRLRYVAFKGLTFSHSTWTLKRAGHNAHQGDLAVGAAIEGDFMDSCEFLNCRFTHLGRHALWLRKGCVKNRMVGCEFSDLGGGAIILAENLRGHVFIQHRTRDNEIANNHIYDCGKVWHGAVGIWVGPADNTRVHHNHIHDLTYSGISCGLTWADIPSGAHHNVIEYNHVHDVMQVMGDGGAIYILGCQPGTKVQYNVIHDIQGWYTYGTGIYLDNGTADITVENNFIARTIGANLVLHQGGRHKIRNNIFALAATGTCHPSGTKDNIMQNNIIYVREGVIFSSKHKNSTADMDHNLYYYEGGEAVDFPEGDTFEQWRARGQDRNSLVADPLFVDVKNGNFNLKKNSPALKTGFRPFKIPVIGPASDDRRKSPKLVEAFALDKGKSRAKKIRARRKTVPQLVVAKAPGKISIDGKIGKYEWKGIKPVRLMQVARGKSLPKAKNIMRLAYDDKGLYVALYNEVLDSGSLRADANNWGANDGAEICFQDVIGKKKYGPVFVVRGYPTGYSESADDGGAPLKDARRLGRAVKFAASLSDSEWTGEWYIPFSAALIRTFKDKKIPFNVCMRRAARHRWVMWLDTGASTYNLEAAGEISFAE